MVLFLFWPVREASYSWPFEDKDAREVGAVVLCVDVVRSVDVEVLVGVAMCEPLGTRPFV